MEEQLQSHLGKAFYKGLQRNLKHMQMAQIDTPITQPLTTTKSAWTAGVIALFFLITLFNMLVIGPALYSLIAPSIATTPGAIAFFPSIYLFYLVWMIPATMLTLVMISTIFLMVKKVGNSLTAHTLMRAIALQRNDKELAERVEKHDLTQEEIEKEMRHTDLQKVQRIELKRFTIAWFVTALVASPFLVLTPNHLFAKTADNTLIYSPYFTLSHEEIPIELIDDIDVGYDESGEHIIPEYEINLKDGRSFNLWEIGIGGTDMDDLITIAKHLDENNVLHLVDPIPNISSLRENIQQDHYQFYRELNWYQ